MRSNCVVIQYMEDPVQPDDVVGWQKLLVMQVIFTPGQVPGTQSANRKPQAVLYFGVG